MRSGWNGSRSPTFSPVPTKNTGRPVTAVHSDAALVSVVSTHLMTNPAMYPKQHGPRGASRVQQYSTAMDRLLATVAERVLSEQFGPRPVDHCGPCEFRRACPAQPEGTQVIE